MTASERHPRPAFTLIELLLVMAIILIVAGISVPVIQTMLDDGRLQGATDMIRAKAAETRAHAMDSGKPWRLAYIPGSGILMQAPDDSSSWEQTDQSLIATPELFRDQLPRGIYIGPTPGAVQGAGAAPSGGGSWQTIAVYTYDGSAREDSITYFGKYGTPPMAMDLRALTGSVTIKTSTEVMAMQP